MGLTHKHREGNNLSVSYADSSPSRRALGISVNGARPLRFLQNSKWRALLSRVGSAMAKNLLVGVGGKARKVKALYVGVGGKARKVKKVYVGVGGKARLVYTSYVAVTGITLTLNDKYADKPTITAVFTPSNATNQKVTWDSSAPGNILLGGIPIISSTDNTCTVRHTRNDINQFTVITATSTDGVTVKYRLAWTAQSATDFWSIRKYD